MRITISSWLAYEQHAHLHSEHLYPYKVLADETREFLQRLGLLSACELISHVRSTSVPISIITCDHRLESHIDLEAVIVLLVSRNVLCY